MNNICQCKPDCDWFSCPVYYENKFGEDNDFWSVCPGYKFPGVIDCIYDSNHVPTRCKTHGLIITALIITNNYSTAKQAFINYGIPTNSEMEQNNDFELVEEYYRKAFDLMELCLEKITNEELHGRTERIAFDMENHMGWMGRMKSKNDKI